MLDDDLRTRLAEWVGPLAELPAPEIRVLRRRIRRRRTRWGAGSVMVVAAAVAVAVAAIGVLPGSGRPPVVSGPKPSAAPGTWYPGRWFAAGKLPAADAGPAAAPYVVTIADGREVVTDVFTGALAPKTGPPSGGSFAGVAAAGDDRTFLLAARTGASVGFYEQRLGQAGRPGTPVLVFALPASSVPAFAISPDASLLAFSTPGGVAVVSLATGASRSWTAASGEVVGLSWVGDKELAFTWLAISAGQVSSVTVRLLATNAPGTHLMTSRQLVSACSNPNGHVCLEENPIGTADGSKVFVIDRFNQGDAIVAAVEEISGGARRTVYAKTYPSTSAAAFSSTCVAPWTDPSGQQLAVYCGQWLTIDNGRPLPVGLHIPVSDLTARGQLMAW